MRVTEDILASPEPPAEPAPAPPPPPKRRRKHPILRALTVLVALVAAGIISVMTIDVGPRVKGLAEREGSKFFDRPMHIG